MKLSLLAGLSLLACISALYFFMPYEPERVWSPYFRRGNELTEWTQFWRTDRPGLEVEVDPDFEHEGSPWLDGVEAEEWTVAELRESEEGTLQLQLWGSDGFQGYIATFEVIEDDPGLKVSVSHVNDVVIPEEFAEEFTPYTPTVSGRVRLSTLDWTAGEPVHYEFGLNVLGHDPLRRDDASELYFLRGSATVLPGQQDP